MMCRFPAGRKSTFPVAVTLNRFFAPLFVFCLGILRFSLVHGGRRRRRRRCRRRRHRGSLRPSPGGRRRRRRFARRPASRRRRCILGFRGLRAGLGQERHLHPRPGHRDLVFDLGDLVQLLLDPLHHRAAVLLVRLFAAAEEDRDQDLIALQEHFLRLFQLGQQVVLARQRTQPHLLHLLDMLLRLRLILLLLLLVLVLAVVEQFANRRAGLRGHFHEIVAPLARDLQRLQGGHLAQHDPVLVHHFHPRYADAVIDPVLVARYRQLAPKRYSWRQRPS